MKKINILLFVFLSLMQYNLTATPGDTTIVVVHNEVQLPWYNTYDQLANFPDGSVSYNKITLEFELGKYNCGGGYNPANAGEISNGGTGWCADWDYDVHVIACTPSGDTLKLGELITPYANTTFPLFPWTWKHSYYFDVTDFYHVLKDDVTIRIFYSGYSGGFTGTTKFHFIEGTRPRDVVSYVSLWDGGFNYGRTAAPIDDEVTAQNLVFPAQAKYAETKVIITGHGGDTLQNCAEFCRKFYNYVINDDTIQTQYIWRDDCASNYMYPQSGTWVHDRANWCPGDKVHTLIHKVPSSVQPNDAFTVDLNFQIYNNSNEASYKLSGIMFYYDSFNMAVDAGIEEVISPTNEFKHRRSNPICGNPEIVVKNYGGETITSIEIEYSVNGGSAQTYTHTTSLESLAETNISLPAIDALSSLTGDNNTFNVKIVNVNGNPDENEYNNERTTTFTASPTWEGGNYIIQMQTHKYENYTMQANWQIIDLATDAVVKQRNGNSSTGKLNIDTINIPDGCYKLVVRTADDYGMNFFGLFDPRGYVRVFNKFDSTRYPLPLTDLGASGLEGNFGSGFTHYFTVANSIGNKMVYSENVEMLVYPNPATDMITVDLIGGLQYDGEIKIFNALGQLVYQQNTGNQKHITINTSAYAAGIYSLHFKSAKVSKIEKIVITK